MKDKILVLGKGFIGTRLQEAFGCEISVKKIYSYKDAEAEVKRFNPSLMINCIGSFGVNVDDCEKDIDKSLMSNAFVPIILSEVAIRNNIRFVHISSGCIYHYDYEKDKPITEDKDPDFFDIFYTRTKIYSGMALKVLSNQYPILTVRIRIPLDNRPHPRNILTKLIKYKKVIDTPNSVTYIPDFISALKHLINIRATGAYNIVNKSGLYYPDLMEIYKSYYPDFKYEIVKFKDLGIIRTNLILSTEKLENTGLKVRDIKDVLQECVREYVKA